MFTRRTLLGSAAALSLMAHGALAQDKLYVPLISKGFQHQFWQAVKTGADKAGQEMGVRVSFDGPDNETQVDKQIDMLAAALATARTEAEVLAAAQEQLAANGHDLPFSLVYLFDEDAPRLVGAGGAGPDAPITSTADWPLAEVRAGLECGVTFTQNFTDIKPGDFLETFEVELRERTL